MNTPKSKDSNDCSSGSQISHWEFPRITLRIWYNVTARIRSGVCHIKNHDFSTNLHMDIGQALKSAWTPEDVLKNGILQITLKLKQYPCNSTVISCYHHPLHYLTQFFSNNQQPPWVIKGVVLLFNQAQLIILALIPNITNKVLLTDWNPTQSRR